MRWFVVFVGVLAAAACQSPTAPGTPLNVEFVLARGDARIIEGTDAMIRFDGVSNDSRCPADVVCILGGDAHVQINVTSNGRTRDHVLHTGDMKPVKHDDLTIHLVQLSPYPFSSRTIAPEEYRATLKDTT